MFGPLFERFTKNTPLTVMTRALLENALRPKPLDELFERVAVEQYERELLFSTVVDGNALAGTHHRIKELRQTRSAALPGKSLVVLDPSLGLTIDVIPCEDGHAQERSLLGPVLETVEPKDLWIEDRNFCTLGFIFGVKERGGAVLVREHKGLPWKALNGLCRVGRIDTGVVFAQAV